MAMVKIQDYFKTVDDEIATTTQEQQNSAQATTSEQDTRQQSPAPNDENPQAPPIASEQLQPSFQTELLPSEHYEDPDMASRPATVFSPPTSNTPQSAQFAYNENDFIPSVEHAQAYQRRLNMISRPTRLPTDAEIAAKATEEEERLASIKEVDVKVRFPDQSQVVTQFGQPDTGKSLYDFVRSCLAEQFAHEKFRLSLSATAGELGSGRGKKLQNTIPDSDHKLLIKDLGIAGRVLISFTWDERVSPATRQGTSLLIPELQSQAQQHKIEQPADTADNSPANSKPEGPGQRQGRKPGTLPKWLKLPGKK